MGSEKKSTLYSQILLDAICVLGFSSDSDGTRWARKLQYSPDLLIAELLSQPSGYRSASGIVIPRFPFSHGNTTEMGIDVVWIKTGMQIIARNGNQTHMKSSHRPLNSAVLSFGHVTQYKTVLILCHPHHHLVYMKLMLCVMFSGVATNSGAPRHIFGSGFPSPPLHSLQPSPPLSSPHPLPSLRSRPPFTPARGSGERCEL